MFKKNLIYIIPLFFLAVIVGYQYTFASGNEEISNTELADLMKKESNDFFFVDVREVHEYNEAHINGMTNIPLSVIANEYDKIPSDKTVVVFCRSGSRSLQAINILEDLGFENLINVKGGMLAWKGDVVN